MPKLAWHRILVQFIVFELFDSKNLNSKLWENQHQYSIRGVSVRSNFSSKARIGKYCTDFNTDKQKNSR